MGFLDILSALKEIVKVDIGDINIHMFNNIRFRTNEDGSDVTIDHEAKTISIDPEKFDDTQKKAFEEKVSPLLLDSGKTILDEKRVDILRLAEQTSDEEAAFFKNLLRKNDYKALLAAKIIKEKFSKNENVDDLRDQLWRRYPDRGINISNLYSAGYFSQFKEIYSELVVHYGGDANKKFLELFDLFVEGPPDILFVGRTRTREDTHSILDQKAGVCKRYGIKKIRIHAIGRENISKAKFAIAELQSQMEFNVKFEEKDSVFMAEISFR